MSTIFPSVTVHVPYKYDMHTVSLFGSYTQNEAHEDSDIDLLLEESPGFRPLMCSVLRKISIVSLEKS